MFEYVYSEVLINSLWLVEHLKDSKVRVVEVNMNPESNKNAHIPGAVFWNIFTDLLMPNLRINLAPIAIEELFSLGYHK